MFRAQSLQDLLDRDEIRSVLYLYSRAVDRGDATLLATLYHPDATDDHGAYSGPAAGFFEYVATTSPKMYDAMHHSYSNILIDLDGDTANVETYFTFTARRRPVDGDVLVDLLVGRFLDRFEKRDGRWRIAARTVVKDLRDARPLQHLDDLFKTSMAAPDDYVYHFESVGATTV